MPLFKGRQIFLSIDGAYPIRLNKLECLSMQFFLRGLTFESKAVSIVETK
jgi:hypothetical protein